jgi:signal transduction histidine kinase/HPt (histidine-containing phosphotransfer) domain-containing protein
METKSIELSAETVRVLVVDDQVMIAEAVRRMLADDSTIELVSVHDGAAALATAEAINPTVILQDLIMPGIDGLDLLKRYRKNPVLQHAHVIVLSSHEDPVIKKACFEAGANDYLVKLPDQVELLARVRLHSQAAQQHVQLRNALQALKQGQRALLEKNAELARLNEQLAEATRFKSEFLANMSHEIRTPLIGVLGMAELLANGQLEPSQRERVDVIRSSGETLLQVLNDVLDISKIESGKLELEATRFDLRNTVDQTLELLAPLAFDKGLEISAWVDAALPAQLVGDPTRFRQIMLNLLSNAIKFTATGEIELRLQRSTADPAFLEGCVEDTGIGIPEDKLGRLFQSFSQADATVARQFGGTGLGLAICRNLLTLMGGRIWVESEAGHGARFFFQIPLTTGLDDSGPCNSDTAPQPRRAAVLLRHQRLLHALTTYGAGLGLSIRPLSGWPTRLLPGEEIFFVDYDAFGKDALRNLSVILPAKVALYTRSRNLAAIQDQFPQATVLSLPVKYRQLISLLDGHEAARLDGEAIEPAAGRSPVKPPVRRVLVADDNAINRQICVAQLHNLGVDQVEEAEDGVQAVDLARAEPFDLIFIDVRMPRMDGFEATRQLRAVLPGHRQPLIVALTANALGNVRELCLDAGMDDFLLKPIRLADLERVLHTLPSKTRQLPQTPPGEVLDASRVQPALVEEAEDIVSIPICNRHQLKQFCRSIGTEAAFRKLVDGFIREMKALTAGLAEVGQDPERLGFAAHKLKAVAGYLGAARLATICERVEAAAKRTPDELATGMLDQLEKTLVLSIQTYGDAAVTGNG